MLEAIVHSDLGMVLSAVPFVGMLLISIFRLDEVVSAPKSRARPRQGAACSLNREGEPGCATQMGSHGAG